MNTAPVVSDQESIGNPNTGPGYNVPMSSLTRRENRRRLLTRVASVLVVVLFLSGCSLPITEPEDFPAAIRNQLDEPVEILEFQVATPETTALVVRIEPGDIHEFPMGAPCAGTGLLAQTSRGEIARLDDRCFLFSDSVWVLREQGDYVNNYYGDSTIYRDE